jgi:integrase
MMGRPQAKRGTVAVEEFRGMLRLRWSYRRKRYNLSTGTPEGQLNRKIAEMTARIIEGDMVTGNFDPTLAKYQHQPQAATSITVTALFEQFTTYKRKGLDGASLAKYKALNQPVNAFFAGQVAGAVDDDRANNFRLHLATWMAPATQRERLITMNACWEWGLKQQLLTDNPWKEVLKRIKVPSKQKPQVFTKDEVTAILDGFRASRHYSHYADFVEFLVSTGCRPGEGIGLQWQNLSHDCGVVWIGEAIARGGKRKPTKTNRSREFSLPANVKAMLKTRCNGQPPDALVFPAPRGGHIDDHNFCRRAWRRILTMANVTYRYPYISRHTFISHALTADCKPMAIAEMVGHDPKVLFSRYAANIGGGLQAPDLFG